MKILQTNLFRKSVKKFHKNQKKYLDKAVRKIIDDPNLGEAKTGDLAGIRVYKFQILTQFILLAYIYDNKKIILILLTFGTHENFYRDLKKSKYTNRV